VVVSNLRGQFEVDAKESGAKLGDEVFDGVTFIAMPLAAEIAIETRRMPSPVNVMPISA
jgi:hypothetical protein